MLSKIAFVAVLSMSSFSSSAEDFSIMMDEPSKAEVSKEDASQRIKDFSLENSKLKRKLEELEKSLKRMKSESSKKDTLIYKQRKSIKELNSKVSLANYVKDMEDRVEMLSDSILSSKKIKSQLDEQEASSRSVIRILEDEIFAKENRAREIDLKMNTFENRRDEVVSEIELLMLSKKSIRESLDKLRNEFNDISSWASGFNVRPIAIVYESEDDDVRVKNTYSALIQYMGDIKTVSVGDYLYGWKVVDISKDYITFSSNSRAYRFYIGELGDRL